MRYNIVNINNWVYKIFYVIIENEIKWACKRLNKATMTHLHLQNIMRMPLSMKLYAVVHRNSHTEDINKTFTCRN